jgi:Leucine-rich repeat (LRR) protein
MSSHWKLEWQPIVRLGLGRRQNKLNTGQALRCAKKQLNELDLHSSNIRSIDAVGRTT